MIRRWRFRVSADPWVLALLLPLLLSCAETAWGEPAQLPRGPFILAHEALPGLTAFPEQSFPLDEAPFESASPGLVSDSLLCPLPVVGYPGQALERLRHLSYPSNPSFARPPPSALPAVQRA